MTVKQSAHISSLGYFRNTKLIQIINRLTRKTQDSLTNLSALCSLSSLTSIPSTLDYLIKKIFCTLFLGKVFIMYFYAIYFLIRSWMSTIIQWREVFYA